MADGTRKKIEDVKVGDLVLATDPTTGKTEKRKVTALIVAVGKKPMVELTVDTDGAKGDSDRAIADYGEAIRIDPKYAAAYGNRGNAYRGTGDNERAIAEWE